VRDPVCPVGNLRRLGHAVPELRATRVHAGHLGTEPALMAGVIQAIEAMFKPRVFFRGADTALN
jgi:proline iminopeptidase